MTTTLTSTGFAVDGGSLQINGSSQIYTPNYGWLHDRFPHKNQTMSSMGVNTAHFHQGGEIPGIANLVTRADGSQFWWYQVNSSNCNCNCDCC